MGIDQRKALLDSIRGQTVVVPNLHPIFEKYTGAVNPNYKAMIPVVNARLESLVTNEKRLAKLKTADFALFASNWWPTAGFNELRIVTFLAIWLFLWDDELDEPTGEHSDNFETAQVYRQETLKFLEGCLGLSPPKEDSTAVSFRVLDNFLGFGQKLKVTLEYYLGLTPSKKELPTSSYRIINGFRVIRQQFKAALEWGLGRGASPIEPPTASHPIIESFRVIGDQLKIAYTVEQRQNFFEDMKFYIATTEIEQKFHLDGKIPTVEEYWEVRMGTSAVAACLAMIEFVHKIRGPYGSTNEPSLKALSDEANIIVVIANDILSLKKEIRLGCIDSLIPLSCLKYGGVQQAIDHAHIDLLAAVARFDSEADKLLSGPNTTPMSDEELRIYIQGSRECWVGNFNWSLCTGRYGLGEIDQKNGSFSVELK